MEHLGEALQKVKQENLQNQSLTIPDSNSVSIYKGELTKGEVGKQTAKIMKSFPKMPKSMIDVLKDRFIENEFNDERMIAAVSNVIDNYEGWDKVPNIANFIQFDKKIKFHTYNDMLNITTEMSPKLREQWISDHVYIQFQGEWRYISKVEHETHKHLFTK